MLQREQEAREIGRCGPESCRRLLGVDVRVARDWRTRRPVSRRRVRDQGRWQWLLIRARHHSRGLQHSPTQEGGEILLAGRIEHELLRHGVSTTGILPLRPRTERDPDRGRVGRRLTVEKSRARSALLCG